jgi:hypothetical protein
MRSFRLAFASLALALTASSAQAMKRTLLAASLAFLSLSGASQAGFIAGNTANSTDHLANFTGSISVTPSSATAATLTVTLTNTTPAANGGFLTAFVLNNPGNEITGISLTSAPANFGLIGTAPFTNGTVNGTPFGQFAFGASTGNGFEGGGSPSMGLAVGSTGTFVFALTGTGLNTLTEASFDNTPSIGSGDGGGHQFFVARFRGLADGGSDKVPGMTTGGAVPEPSSLALMGIAGTIGLVVRRVRKGRVA